MVDDGRTTEHGYTISSPCEPDGSGELKIRYTPANPSFSIWWVYFSWTYFPDVAVEMSVALANVLPWQWGGGGIPGVCCTLLKLSHAIYRDFFQL